MATSIRYDSCLTLFWLMGSVIIVITLLALLSIAVPELSDLSHLVSVATESEVIEAILITMVAALVAVVFLVIFGTPLAYVLSRSTFRGKGIIENIVDVPLALPHTVSRADGRISSLCPAVLLGLRLIVLGSCLRTHSPALWWR